MVHIEAAGARFGRVGPAAPHTSSPYVVGDVSSGRGDHPMTTAIVRPVTSAGTAFRAEGLGATRKAVRESEA